MRTAAVVIAAVAGAAVIVLLAQPQRSHERLPHATPADSRTSPRAVPAPPDSRPAPADPVAASKEPRPPRAQAVDAATLAVALGSEDEATRADAIENLFPELVRRNSAAARRFVETVTDSAQRARLLQVLAVNLAVVDRSDALAWAEGLQDAEERDAATGMVLMEISMTDPGEAVRLRQGAQTSADDPVLQNLAQRWAEADLAAAVQWADSLPPGEQRDRVNARVAFIQAQTAPETAARLIMDRMSSGTVREEALISVLHQWARADFAAAKRWLEDLPPGPMKVRAAAEISAISQSKADSTR